MEPLTWTLVAQLVIKYGPDIVPLLEKIWGNIAAGRGNNVVTAEDFAELMRLSNLTASDIYRRAGVEPPAQS